MALGLAVCLALLPAPATLAWTAPQVVRLDPAALLVNDAATLGHDRLLWLWLVGAGLCAVRQYALQHRFTRRLGRLVARPDGSHAAASTAVGPALVGLLVGAGTEAMNAVPLEVEASYKALHPPRYPADAIARQQSGDVVLRVQVGSDGLPKDVEVESSSGVESLDAAAREAVRGWTFNPRQRDGQAIEQWVLVPISFRADETEPMDLPDGTIDRIDARSPQDG